MVWWRWDSLPRNESNPHEIINHCSPVQLSEYMHCTCLQTFPCWWRKRLRFYCDGSKGTLTARIATNMPQLSAVSKLPVHQKKETKGHGGAVNTGMAKERNGKYSKVVDSDDWWMSTCVLKSKNNYNALKLAKKSMWSLRTLDLWKRRRENRRKSCATLQHSLKIRSVSCRMMLKTAKMMNTAMMRSLIYNMNLLQAKSVAVARATFVDGFICLRTRFNIASLYCYMNVDSYRYRSWINPAEREKSWLARIDSRFESMSIDGELP